jgi:hypothetical protein
LSTTTRARPRAGSIQPKAITIGSPEATLEAARKLISQTKRQATMIMREDGTNRSTRAQRAQRAKAEAFERLGDIIAGR